jgi:predicted DNA binding CopG/RHH family protein
VFKELEFEDEDDDKGKINNFDNNKNKINNIKKGVDVIEERPEDEEKEKDYKQKIKDIKNIKPSNKRVIQGKKGQISISDFLESKSKK